MILLIKRMATSSSDVSFFFIRIKFTIVENMFYQHVQLEFKLWVFFHIYFYISMFMRYKNNFITPLTKGKVGHPSGPLGKLLNH